MPQANCPNQAFLLAMAAWSAKSASPGSASSPGTLAFDHEPQSHFTAEMRQDLEPIFKQLRGAGDTGLSPAEALRRLKQAHNAEARPDFERIHPTWWLRALREEPPSVRATVARHGPPQVRAALSPQAEPLSSETGPRRGIPEEILGWVLAIWAERLVGDLPERNDDPLAISGLTRLADRSIYRLIRLTGLVKLALANPRGEILHDSRLRPIDLDRIDGFVRFFTPITPVVHTLARSDVEAVTERHEAWTTANQWLALIGLATFGRLLCCSEPYRVRWALQHLPYPIAKRIRTQMPRQSLVGKPLINLENLVLSAAWRRLDQEGMLSPRKGSLGGAAH